MKLAVTFTVCDRPKYFKEVLDSWSNVRGKEDVNFYFSVEPKDWYVHGGESSKLAEAFLKENKVVGRVYHNATNFGILKNPHVALTRALSPKQIDYAVLAEDDLVVSSDVLEYHKWAAQEYVHDKEIAMICSFSEFDSAQSLDNLLLRVPRFGSVHIWGTWKDRWEEYIGPTWGDNSGNTDDLNEVGWDYNLSKTVLPKLGKKSIQPLVSRVKNIGVYGVYSQGVVVEAPSFRLDRDLVPFIEVEK